MKAKPVVRLRSHHWRHVALPRARRGSSTAGVSASATDQGTHPPLRRLRSIGVRRSRAARRVTVTEIGTVIGTEIGTVIVTVTVTATATETATGIGTVTVAGTGLATPRLGTVTTTVTAPVTAHEIVKVSRCRRWRACRRSRARARRRCPTCPRCP